MRVLHVISGLGVGGAEAMLAKLLGFGQGHGLEHSVISLTNRDEMAAGIRQCGVPIHWAGLKASWGAPAGLLRLRRLARELEPDVVQGWMYHGNLAATMVARWSAGRPRVIWNIRHSLADISRETWPIQGAIRLGARWSSGADAIIHNATVSIAQHARVGYTSATAVMIPNGFDLETFRPDPAAGEKLRARLGVPPATLLAGTLGRRHPMKGQADFLRAAARVAAGNPRLHVVMAGRGVDDSDGELRRLAAVPPLAGRVHLLGDETAPAAYLAGLDVFCQTSLYGEGFPNVLGEAMACGVPCVTTDVAESAAIVGPWGAVVGPGDPEALTRALGHQLALSPAERRQIGLDGRASIAARYAMPIIAQRYAGLYLSPPGRQSADSVK